MAPEILEVKLDRLGDFERAFDALMQEVASGVHSNELKDTGVVISGGIDGAVKLRPLTSQAVNADDFIQLAVDYSPVLAPIGKQLWEWAWPKLRSKFDGVKSVEQKRH